MTRFKNKEGMLLNFAILKNSKTTFFSKICRVTNLQSARPKKDSPAGVDTLEQ